MHQWLSGVRQHIFFQTLARSAPAICWGKVKGRRGEISFRTRDTRVRWQGKACTQQMFVDGGVGACFAPVAQWGATWGWSCATSRHVHCAHRLDSAQPYSRALLMLEVYHRSVPAGDTPCMRAAPDRLQSNSLGEPALEWCNCCKQVFFSLLQKALEAPQNPPLTR